MSPLVLIRHLVRRIQRIRCGMYVGTCSLCEEWKREKAAQR